MSENKPDDMPTASDAPLSEAGVPEMVSDTAPDTVHTATDTTDPETTKASVPPRARTGKGGVAFLWLLVLLLLAAVGYLGWQHWLQQQSQPTVIALGVNQLEGRLENLHGELTELRRHVEGSIAAVDERGEVRSRELRERLMRQEGRINEMNRSDRDGWVLTEVDYLLRLASQRLLVDRDPEVAGGLLVSADALLRDLDDTEFYSLRQAIATDLQALRVVRKVDRTGLYLRLAALQGSIAELPLERHEPNVDSPGSAVSSDQILRRAGSGDWWQRSREAFRAVWDHLDDYIRIYRRDEPLQPLLSPDEESYLRLNLNLMLEQAQVALLREQPDIYEASLIKASEWVKSYFVANDARDAILEDIERLRSTEVVQGAADLSASLQAMKEVLNARPFEGEPASGVLNP